MSARKPTPEAPAPEYTSDRLRLLAPLLTPRVMELARNRLVGIPVLKGKSICVPDEKPVVKIALLVVLEMNPFEKFGVEEEAIMRGMDSDAINPQKKEGLIRVF